LGAADAFFLDAWAPLAYKQSMAPRLITVAETPLFLSQAEKVWSGTEHEEFIDYIAGNPAAGDVIPGTGGVRKVLGKGGGRQAGWRASDLLFL
jgi:hypothetical protein